MTLPIRIAFDPELPVIASQEITTGGRTFKADQPFPWRELGIDVSTLHAFWMSGMIHHPTSLYTDAVTPTEPPQQSKPKKRDAARG